MTQLKHLLVSHSSAIGKDLGLMVDGARNIFSVHNDPIKALDFVAAHDASGLFDRYQTDYERLSFIARKKSARNRRRLENDNAPCLVCPAWYYSVLITPSAHLPRRDPIMAPEVIPDRQVSKDRQCFNPFFAFLPHRTKIGFSHPPVYRGLH